jgi:hypothetical protein
MLDRVFKVLPYLFGLLIGWIIFYPPEWMAPLGAWRFLVTFLLVIVLQIATTAFHVAMSIPEDVRLEPLPDLPLDGELGLFAGHLQNLGFVPAGPPRRLTLRPAAVLVPFVHEQEPVYGVVARLGTVPSTVSFEMFSYSEGRRGSLASINQWMGAVFPHSPGRFVQVIPMAPPAHVFAAHQAALAELGARGLVWQAVSPDRFEEDYLAGCRRQRRMIRSNLVRVTLTVLWRVLRKTSPHIGPVQKQAGAEQRIQEALVAGQAG